MSKYTEVTLSRGGAAERKVKASDIHIPDLWHVIKSVQDGTGFSAPEVRLAMVQAIDETWVAAHSLRRHVLEHEDPTGLELLAQTGRVPVHEGDLRIAIEMLRTMYDILHRDQPACECCDGEGAELIVETPGGQTRNITKHVPVVIEHFAKMLEGGEE